MAERPPLSRPDSFQRSPSMLGPFPLSSFALCAQVQDPVSMVRPSCLSQLLDVKNGEIIHTSLLIIPLGWWGEAREEKEGNRLKKSIRTLDLFRLLLLEISPGDRKMQKQHHTKYSSEPKRQSQPDPACSLTTEYWFSFLRITPTTMSQQAGEHGYSSIPNGKVWIHTGLYTSWISPGICQNLLSPRRLAPDYSPCRWCDKALMERQPSPLLAFSTIS